jgi:putative spermidine/putrescine transport system ATP-binding protein
VAAAGLSGVAPREPGPPQVETTARAGSVELRGLTKLYGAERVVDRFDVAIRAGEFFSLLGPSGSGKTTTLMMIAGFAPVDEGEIRVDGRDVSGQPPRRRGFGMVFQNYAIFPHLNVFENVAFPLRARGLPKAEIRERVRWALELVRLERLADRFSRQLSGGQQQRVAVARAIVFHPAIVLMDEPLAALDKNLRYDMQVELKEIQQRLGMTMIYVTHDQEEAMNLSDRIAIMNRGRVEQIGAPAEVYERPVNAFTAQFLGEANLLPGTVQELHSGEALFRAASGALLRARVQEGVQPGAPARLFVRPEKLALVDRRERDAADNRMQGRLRRISFLGSVLRLAVDVGNESDLVIDRPNLSHLAAPAIGAPVEVSWSAADSLILTA